MDIVETEVRKIIQMRCKYRTDFLKRDGAMTDLASGVGGGFIQIMYGGLALAYPFDSEPETKLAELDVVFDGFHFLNGKRMACL